MWKFFFSLSFLCFLASLLLVTQVLAANPQSWTWHNSTVQALIKAITPTPTARVLGVQTPKKVPTTDHSLFLAEINAYRAKYNLTPVQASNQTCAFAKTRAQEIVSDFSHRGFRSRINAKTLPYTQWSSATENIAMTTKSEEVVSLWINSPAHAANMRKDTPFVCVQKYGDNYAYEGMKL
ncbi:MAG: CAP domain-containing protein [Patescibacteria group bacterium]